MRKEALEKLKEKARKWDRVKEIAARSNMEGHPCKECPVYDECDVTVSLCGNADAIVYALEKEPT